jgi:hypothetical protein
VTIQVGEQPKSEAMSHLPREVLRMIVAKTTMYAFKKGWSQPVLYRDDTLSLLPEFMRQMKPTFKVRRCVVITCDISADRFVDMAFCDVDKLVEEVDDEKTRDALSSYDAETCVPLIVIFGAKKWCRLCPFTPKQDVTVAEPLACVSTEGLELTEMPCENNGGELLRDDCVVKDDIVTGIVTQIRNSGGAPDVSKFMEGFYQMGKVTIQKDGEMLPVCLDDALEIQAVGMAVLATKKARDEWRRVNFLGFMKSCIKHGLIE